MAAGQARSVRDALRAVEGGAAPPVELAAAGGDVVAALGVVATRLEALQDANTRLGVEVRALRSEVEGLKALPASERPAAVEGRGAGDDGPVVRAARWLEQRLRGKGGAG
jgi:hypothetical protein